MDFTVYALNVVQIVINSPRSVINYWVLLKMVSMSSGDMSWWGKSYNIIRTGFTVMNIAV